MNLFIDTNIYLSFYYFTDDDLEELKKLAVLVDRGEVSLLLPAQVVDEFKRNRANKIAYALKKLRSQRLSPQFPQLCRDYEEYIELRELLERFEFLHGKLMHRIQEDTAQENLKADKVIHKLFRSGERIAVSQTVLERARLRMDLGNPPGKNGSLGDAVVWETLLEIVAAGEDLYFVSADNDYFSPLDTDLVDPFLLDEWACKKDSQLHAYKELGGLFRDEFPDIKLETELEKELLIEQLAESHSFERTHTVIWKLSRFSGFTPAQVRKIVTIAVTNDQVYWIASDRDVRGFLTRVIRGSEEMIEAVNFERLNYVLEEMEPYGEIPF